MPLSCKQHHHHHHHRESAVPSKSPYEEKGMKKVHVAYALPACLLASSPPAVGSSS